jgi:hypothetical protein
MLRCICHHTRRDHVQLDDILERLRVAPVEEKLVQYYLRWSSVRNEVIKQTDNERRD